MRNRLIAVGCLVIVGLGIVLLGGAALFAASIPSVSQQLPPDSAPLLVNLTTPLDSSDVPLDTPTSIQASALGTQSIVSLELWVDGNPAETKAAPAAGTKQLDAFWTWQPDAPGAHTLVVRATDSGHHVVNSNVVRINAGVEPASAVAVNYQVKAGDTLASIAQKSGATLGELVNANLQMNPNNPVAVGQTISVPVKLKPAKTGSVTATVTTTATVQPPPPPAPQATPQAATPLSSDPFAGVKFWGKKSFAADALFPTAPTLSAHPNGCAAELDFTNVADNADSIFVYRTGAGSPQFTRIGSLGAPPKGQSWSYVDDKVAGPLEYYVAAANTLGESPSKIVGVNITDSACGLQFAANPVFKGGQIVPTQPVDKVYCYLSENSGAWSRVPPAPGTFIVPTNGVFDVSVHLKSLAATATGQMTMDLDCWGWRGGSLAHLGEAKQPFTPLSNGPVQLAGDKFKFVGATNPLPVKPFKPTLFIFPPTGLRSTSDPAECSSHGGILVGWACEGAIMNHWPVLVWDWESGLAPNGQQPVDDIDGYHVYENDLYFQHMLVTSTTGGPGNTVGLFPLPVIPPLQKAGLGLVNAGTQSLNRCFVARAYKGTTESNDGNTFCLGGLPGTQTVILNATATDTVWNVYNTLINPIDPKQGRQQAVGYDFADNTRDLNINPLSGGHLNIVLRTLVRFDLSKIGVVSRATLRYQLDSTSYGDNEDSHDPSRLAYPVDTYLDRSCAVELMLLTQDWTPKGNIYTPNNLVPAEDYIELPTNGSDYSVDVTSAVNHWHSFGGNYGFALRGANEDTGSEENSQCLSDFRNFTLDVTFFP